MDSKNSEENAYDLGKGFRCDVDFDYWKDNDGKYKASVNIGEEYYESDPYQSQDLALCEVKGWLEGVMVKIETTLNSIKTIENYGTME